LAVKQNEISSAFLAISDPESTEEVLKEKQEQLLQAQKMEAIGRLAGGVAHDFNNLIGAITGYTDILRDSLSPHDPLQGDIQQIKSACRQASKLTKQLLAFGRKQPSKPRVIDLNDLVNEMLKMIQRVIGEDIHVETKLESNLGAIKVDDNQLQQVLMNLAINARDAMPSGGTLTISTRNTKLMEKMDSNRWSVPPGDYVNLSVSDTGVGMSEDVIARVFEPFFTTKETGKGSGLGLSTAYGIVKQNRGSIRVKSAPGQGSVFNMYFPRVHGPVTRKVNKMSTAPMKTGTETVLVVEDEGIFRDLIVRILKRDGYKTLEAANGGEALMICEEHKEQIDLMLTDVIMPQMNGRKLVERTLPLHPEMKVLYMSGYTDDVIADHGVLEEGVEFIEKPFSANVLLNKVREVLDS